MARGKQIRAQVINAQTIVFDETVTGLKNERDLLQRALAVCSANDGGAIRKQQIGARGWAYFLFDKGTRQANRVTGADADTLESGFENARGLV